MTAKELAAKAADIAKNYKTLYIMGCFGAPMTEKNKKRYTNNHSYNKQADRTAMINAASADTFGFDCVCLIKGILWGWCGNENAVYGGATYASNGVPDIGADSMIKVCEDVSSSGWADMKVGEAVWLPGHIGIYIGDGLAVECTPKWDNRVQITAVGNMGERPGYNTRTWEKHGKLPYVTYHEEEQPMITQEQFNAMMAVYLEQQAAKEPSEWSAEARAYVEERGIIKGTGDRMEYCRPVTREELAQVIYNMNL